MKHTEPVNYGELWQALRPGEPNHVPSQRHSPTSREAASNLPNADTLRALVLGAIKANGGLTDEEGCERLAMNPSTYRPRRCELVESGLVRDSGTTRQTRAGRRAVVWEVVDSRGMAAGME